MTPIKSSFPSVLDLILAAGLLAVLLFRSLDRQQIVVQPAQATPAYVRHNDKTSEERWQIELDSNNGRIYTAGKAGEHGADAMPSWAASFD